MDRFHISPESFNPDILDFGDDMPPAETIVDDDGIIDEPPHRANDLTSSSDTKRVSDGIRQRREPVSRATTDVAAASRPVRKKNIRRQEHKPAVEHHRQGIISRFIKDSRTRVFAGIILGLATVYLLVVALSYFATVVHDQNLVLNNNLDALTEKSSQISNIGGPLGAWISDLIITRWLGVGAFILIFYMAMVTLMLLTVRHIDFWSLTFRCLLSTIALSIIVGLATLELDSAIMWGGAHGHYLNQKIITLAGLPGAIIVSVIMAAMVTLIFLSDLKKGYVYISRILEERRKRILARRAAEAERRRAEEEAQRQRAIEIEKENGNKSDTDIASSSANISDASSTENEHDSKPVDGSSAENDNVALPLQSPGPIMTLDTVGDMEIMAGTIEQADMEESADDAGCQPMAIGEAYDPRADLSRYRFPSLDLLHDVKTTVTNVDAEEQEENKQRITKTLLDYGIPISSIRATVGPTVTLYEIVPAEGVRIAKIKRLEDDIALSLAALGIRIIAPIPGKGTIGIEVPNKDPQVVAIKQILGSKAYQESRMELPMALGSTISNDVFIADLTKMPHLLVAGATGMGKSVGLNTIVASLIYKKHPAELKFVFVDPKMVEFSPYAKLERHYLAKLPGDDSPIITDPSKVVATLNSLCLEMDNRYSLLMEASCRNLKEYNAKFIARRLNPEKGHRYLPYIVVIVDEFGDLILTAGKEVETPISRIAAKARAVGIHMILATQRPSTNVITGVIKANFPGRMAFRVFQMVDSRTILDRPGANQLIGRGDMLFSNNGKIDRVQCAFIDTDEVEAVCNDIDSQIGYDHAYELPEYIPEDPDTSAMGNLNDRDSLFEEAARFVVQSSTASTSSLQRRYSIGYNRAGKIMDQLEAAGIVGPSMGGKPRSVLIDSLQLERMLEIAG